MHALSQRQPGARLLSPILGDWLSVQPDRRGPGGLGLHYVGERGLSWWKRILLGGIRLLMFVLIILLLFEPVEVQAKKITVPSNVLVLLDVSQSMNFADGRKKNQDLEDAALALGKMAFADPTVPESVKAEVAGVTRLALAKGILRHPDLSVFQKPGDRVQAAVLRVATKLESAPGNPEELKEMARTGPGPVPGHAPGRCPAAGPR